MWSAVCRRAVVFCAVFVLSTSCNDAPESVPDWQLGSHTDELTSIEAVERQLTLESYVYVSYGSSNSAVLSAAQKQLRTAFAPLRLAGISVDDREMKYNLDVKKFVREPITLVTYKGGKKSWQTSAWRVRYRYQARALVNKNYAYNKTLPLTLLSPGYDAFTKEIIQSCVENYDHDREFIKSFWYVWSPRQAACRQLINAELTTIQTARTGLSTTEVPDAEYYRRYFPVTAQLTLPAGATTTPTTYPEYDRLYGLQTATKQTPVKSSVIVYNIVGRASHWDDPVDQQYQNDMGFEEYFKFLRKLTDKYGSKLKVATTSWVNPFRFYYGGKLVDVSVDMPYQWVVAHKNFPAHVTSEKQDAFLRFYHDYLKMRWVTLQVPVQVNTLSASKSLTLEFRTIYGTDSTSIDVFRQAYKNGDVVAYDGHSYLGIGPMDPENFNQYNFKPGYQILFFNSCVSFNYYGVNFFGLKKAGSADLDLVSNGIEVYIYRGGDSLGQFVTALFDTTPNSWRTILERTRVPWSNSFGYHDPNRAVDGELDNKFTPSSVPLKMTY